MCSRLIRGEGFSALRSKNKMAGQTLQLRKKRHSFLENPKKLFCQGFSCTSKQLEKLMRQFRFIICAMFTIWKIFARPTFNNLRIEGSKFRLSVSHVSAMKIPQLSSQFLVKDYQALKSMMSSRAAEAAQQYVVASKMLEVFSLSI